jgi:hypothetical protein
MIFSHPVACGYGGQAKPDPSTTKLKRSLWDDVVVDIVCFIHVLLIALKFG